MEIFFKTSAIILVAVILALFLGKWEKDISILICIAACCIAGAAVVIYIEPVITFLKELTSVGEIQDDMVKILIKAVGVTMIAEIAAMICTDAGNGALAKMLQILCSCTVLYLTIPIFQSVLHVLMEIIGEL